MLELAGGGADYVHQDGPTGYHQRAAHAHEHDGAEESEGRTNNGPPPDAQAEDYSAEDERNNCASHELSPLQITEFFDLPIIALLLVFGLSLIHI